MANSPSGDSMVSRFVRILATFDVDRTAQSATEIARRSGLPMSTTHRLATELTSAGLLDRDDEGQLRIGLRLWELTTRGSRALGLRQIAMPFIRTVQERVRQHTQLGVLDEHEVLFLELLSDPNAGANITRIAGRLPLHASSSGLILLAFGERELQESVLSGPLPSVGPGTPTDPAQLRRKLAEVRRLGYAEAPGAVEAVSTGVAVPVRANRRRSAPVIAALGVVLPRDPANGATLGSEAALAALLDAAQGICGALDEAITLH